MAANREILFVGIARLSIRSTKLWEKRDKDNRSYTEGV